MKTIKSLKDITILEVGDAVVFKNLVYKVRQNLATYGYYLFLCKEDTPNDTIFDYLNLNKIDFINSIGINARIDTDFPETKSLEALTAIVSALFKKYEKQNELPKTWEEFCKRNPIKEEECWIECFDGAILGYADVRIKGKYREPDMDRNMCTSKQEAEAFLALMQLRQLRKAYVKDWEPDWMSECPKYCIVVSDNKLGIQSWYHTSYILSFPKRELVKQFLTNFKDLLEIAKPLL